MAARLARQALADDRALEEQAERMNPVNPKRVLGTRKGRTSLVLEGSEYTGAGATPSMGLSQFRGGAIGYGMGEESSSESEGEELVGRGTKKGMVRKTARRAYEKSDAYEMGSALSGHLHKLHGAGFWSDFADGFKQGVGMIASPVKEVASFIPHPAAQAVSAGLGVLGYGKKKCGGRVGAGADLASLKAKLAEMKAKHSAITGRGVSGRGGRVGAGKLVITHGAGTSGNVGAGNVKGPGYEAVSAVKGGRVGAGSDGRKKRAEIVKRVMAERGVSMIEASKIVKAEGLY